MINFLKYTLSLSFTGTDIKQEIQMLKQHMIKEFKQKGKKVVYNPEEFEQFCCEAGATSIFTNLLESVCTSRQEEKNAPNIASILYKLCYALSQKCNFLQKDNSLFMISNNLNKEAMNTERQLGNTCSARTGYRMLEEAE